MDEEKQRLLSEEDGDLVSDPPQAQPPKRQVSRWRRVVIGLLVLQWCWSVWMLYGPDWPSCPHDVRDVRSYVGENIKWTACGTLEDHDLECSDIDVPMDQFSKENSGNKTFNIPLIRMRGKNATENLLVNPGGPGGSGISFVYRAGKMINTIVGENFHILSFDPRGINSSTPNASCYPDKETRASRSSIHYKDPIRDHSSIWAWSDNFVQACADTMGEHGKYLNTPQTAADMNSILDAVGQETMTYWGFSYGTTLGQTYASLFPERSERVIIDGVSNQFEWYDSLVLHSDMDDTENVLAGFFEECVKAGPGNCTLAQLADKKPTLLETHTELGLKVMRFLKNLNDDPMSVYVNSTMYGTLDYQTMLYGAIFPALYKPQNWYTLADNIAQMMRGNGTAALMAYGLSEGPGEDKSDQGTVIMTNDGASGKKNWPKGKKALLEMILPFLDESIFALAMNDGYYSKSKWVIPNTHHFKPAPGVQTSHPMLILSTTYDPICPLVSAKVARDSYVDSRLIEVKGYGHCSIAVQSTCMADHVRAFLEDGTLPTANHTKCEVDGAYFVKPEDKDKMMVWGVEGKEKEEIHAAQMGISDAIEVVRW